MAGKNYDINFRIKTDAKPTRKELEMTVAEFKDFNRTVRASQTPLDRFEKDLSDLNKTFKAGGVSSKQYAHRLNTLESRFEKTGKQAKGFKDHLKGAGVAMAGFIAANVTFSAVQQGLQSVREEMERIDELGKTAQGIGASTEFLSGLEFIAQGVSGLSEGGATKGIEKMTRRLAEAANGTGEAKVALDMLGVSIDELKGKTPEEQFRILSRAMDKVTDTSERLLIATKLFDDEQAKLHTTMSLTNDQYDLQAEKAKSLGAIVTEEEAKKAAAYTESMQQLDLYNAKYKKALAMNSLGGLNIFSAESQISRGSFATSFLEGDMETKAELGLGFLSGGLFGTTDKTSLALSGRTGNRAKSQEEIDAQRKKYQEEETVAYDKETKRLLDQMEKGKSEARWAGVTGFFDKQVEKARETADVLGGGLGHFGLSVAGQFDRGMNVNRSKKDDQFEAIVTDPLDSIAASSSEAFKIQNKNTSFQKVTEESEKETAKNTKGLWDTQTSMLSLLENATGIGL
ncbi:hypothetical protein N8508_00855 [bacterium]|nr:hypothetical protein [bacterium]